MRRSKLRMQIGLDEMLRMLKKIKGLANVQLIAVE